MKTFFFFFISILFVFMACKPEPTSPPEGWIDYKGNNYKEPVPVEYDSDGDGEPDAVIEVLGTNLNVNQNSDGSSLHSSDSSDSKSVPSGEKLCYEQLSRNCDEHGVLYAFETTMNPEFSELQNISDAQQIDQNDDGVLDYV
ncbi:MAG: hypothetical protein R6U95_03715, partial [Bacteroidales bacterium]